MEESKRSLNLNINSDMFPGVFGNMFRVAVHNAQVVLDVVYVDYTTSDEETGDSLGQVVSRINMTVPDLLSLQAMLNSFISDNIDIEVVDD